jgi:hypothetical protein
MRSEKKIIAAITFIVCLMMALSACNKAESHTAQQHQPQDSPANAKRRIPAHFTEPPSLNSLQPTLDPDLFAEFSNKEVRAAYQVAKEIPQTLAQLPCFCECDKGGHKSLHSCYEDKHATGCDICVDSALMAGELKQKGISDAKIREILIAKYSDSHGH